MKVKHKENVMTSETHSWEIGGSQVTRTTVVHQFHYWQSVVDEAGLHILLHPGIQDARKWIENEKMKKRKWRMNEEMDRE